MFKVIKCKFFNIIFLQVLLQILAIYTDRKNELNYLTYRSVTDTHTQNNINVFSYIYKINF